MRDVEYIDLDDRLFNNTVLKGQHYAINNKRYYAEFKSNILDEPGWTFVKHIDANKDGCGTVLALKKQYEGKSANITIKAKLMRKTRCVPVYWTSKQLDVSTLCSSPPGGSCQT